MKRYLIIPAVLFSILSCGNPYVIDPIQTQSAKLMPCEPAMIEIIEHKTNPDGSETWNALCNGDTYDCEKEAGENGKVSCEHMESQMPE
jgi:hypothetical protein